MTWSNPAYLLGFWLVAAVIVLYAWSQRRTFRNLRTLVSENMSRSLLPRPGRTRAWVKGFFLLLALSLFCMTLAGPQFGFRIEKVARRGTDLFVLLDTSRSMLAEDVAPNRLAGAKLDIEDLLLKSAGDRVGLIAFAGKPVTQVPLTTDLGFFRDVLHRIDTETAPRGGTAIGDAIRLATRLLPRDTSRDKAIVLITDGEDHESMPLEAARDAAAAGIRIYTVAIGDFKEGARIPLFDKNGNRTGFEKYQGREVWSKADAPLLTEIAKISGAAFIPAGTTVFDLGTIYSDHLESLKRSESGEEERQIRLLQYQLFLLGGIVAFLVFLAISPYKEKTRIALAAQQCFEQKRRARSDSKNMPVASLLLVLTLAGSAFAEGETPIDPPAQKNTAGTDTKSPALDKQNDLPDDVAKTTGKPLANESSVQKYNRAYSLMQSDAQDEAQSLFRELLLDRNARISAKSQLNLGLILAREIMNPKPQVSDTEAQTTVPGQSPDTGLPGIDTQGQAPKVQQGQLKSALEQYMESRKKRMESQNELRSRVRQAADHFAHAADYSETATEARRNLDVLLSWQKQQDIRWRQAEQKLRAQTLSFGELLQWLEQNGRQTDDALTSHPQQPDAATWQQWFDAGAALKDLDADFDAASQKYDELKKQNQAQAKGQAKSDDDRTDLVPGMLAEAKKQYGTAAANLARFDQTEAVPAIRDSIGRINALSSLLIPYPALVKSSVAFQEEQVKATKKYAGKKDLTEPFRLSQYKKSEWNSQFVRRWVSLMMNLAQQEFAKNPPKENPDPQDIPLAGKDDTKSNTKSKEKVAVTPSKEKAKPAPENKTEGKPTTGTDAKQISPEEKIRQSMELARKLGPRIQKEIDLLNSELSKNDDAKAASRQEEILKLLKEIAKPLEDPDKQNQDQQNQDQTQQNQDQQQQKQDKQDKQQDQNENQKQDQARPDQKDQKKDADRQDEQSQGKEQKQDDKEKESLLRQIKQRQRDAQEERKAVERFHRRTDKPEKDW